MKKHKMRRSQQRHCHSRQTERSDSQLRPGGELEMDHGSPQALVAVLQADHALHVCGRGLLRCQADSDWSLRELLATLGWEVAHNFSLRTNYKMC